MDLNETGIRDVFNNEYHFQPLTGTHFVHTFK